MPFATTTQDYYGVDTDTSGWLTATGTTAGISGSTNNITWVTSNTQGTTATVGTAYYDTTDNNIRIYNGDISGGSDGWVGVDNSNVTVQGLVEGDVVHVQYDSNGVNMANPYVYVETAGSKEARIKEHLRQLMKSNLLIKMGTRQLSLNNKVTPQEIKARQTLRDQITERQWRGYVTNGFVMVQGDTGKFYQVFNDQRHIKVYKKGKLTDEICIHTEADTKCPPTDHILNMMFLIQNDENIIWTKGVGNVYNKDGSGICGVAGNIVMADGQAMQAFIAGGEDVPVEFVGSTVERQGLSLVETYKKLKAA